MKLIIQNDRIAATATDEYSGPEAFMDAPDGLDPARLAEYRLVDGQLALRVPESIDPLQGLLAIDAAGMAGVYEAWATDPARTFAERAFIQRAKVWRRDDPLLQGATVALGMTSAQVDDLFRLAVTL